MDVVELSAVTVKNLREIGRGVVGTGNRRDIIGPSSPHGKDHAQDSGLNGHVHPAQPVMFELSW